MRANYSFKRTAATGCGTIMRRSQPLDSSVSVLKLVSCRLLHLVVSTSLLLLAACAAERPHEQPMSEAEKVVQRQLDAYNAHDLQAFVATYSDDVSVYKVPATSPTMSGKQQLTEFYRDSRFSLPDLHAELLHRSVVGNKVIDHERILGLRNEPVDAVVAYVVRNGLIQSVWLFYAE